MGLGHHCWEELEGFGGYWSPRSNVATLTKGQRGEVKLHYVCKIEHRSSDISGTAVWKKFPGCNLTHRIRGSSPCPHIPLPEDPS
jgi:hypothetical protein